MTAFTKPMLQTELCTNTVTIIFFKKACCLSAFDKININRLQETYKKISISKKGINFITELHTSHLAKIIIFHGLTAPNNINL